jgi:uncharacterized protein (TIGR02118 family)
MTRLLVLYKTPADTAAFDTYYFHTHVPLAKTIPGLRAYTVNDGSLNLVAGNEAPYLIAQLDFDTPADLQLALASPEGMAAAADLVNFGQAGVTILTFETRTL